MWAMTNVRLARESDLEAVLAVGHATWPSTYGPIAGPDYVKAGLEKWWSPELTLSAIRRERVLVAGTAPDRVEGMAAFSYDGEAVVLWKLYVAPAAQGSGLGAALLDAVIDAARPKARLLRLAFMDGNLGARGFYERQGFRETSRKPDALGGPDNVWMEREIGAD
jgi:ribosomal protein S18 acetylase RimI-like enzyme